MKAKSRGLYYEHLTEISTPDLVFFLVETPHVPSGRVLRVLWLAERKMGDAALSVVSMFLLISLEGMAHFRKA
jgi:hypothetical protein